MPYWVGTKNGLVVTWLTKTNFHLGWAGKLPWPPPPDVEPVAQASRKPGTVAPAATQAAPRRSWRRLGRGQRPPSSGGSPDPFALVVLSPFISYPPDMAALTAAAALYRTSSQGQSRYRCSIEISNIIPM